MEELRKEADEGMRAFIAATQVLGRGGLLGCIAACSTREGAARMLPYSCFSLVRRRP
jgi:hypothetical protein